MAIDELLGSKEFAGEIHMCNIPQEWAQVAQTARSESVQKTVLLFNDHHTESSVGDEQEGLWGKSSSHHHPLLSITLFLSGAPLSHTKKALVFLSCLTGTIREGAGCLKSAF